MPFLPHSLVARVLITAQSMLELASKSRARRDLSRGNAAALIPSVGAAAGAARTPAPAPAPARLGTDLRPADRDVSADHLIRHITHPVLGDEPIEDPRNRVPL